MSEWIITNLDVFCTRQHHPTLHDPLIYLTYSNPVVHGTTHSRTDAIPEDQTAFGQDISKLISTTLRSPSPRFAPSTPHRHLATHVE